MLFVISDDNADIFAVALLMSCCIFSSLILLSEVMITLYTSFNEFCPIHKALSNEIAVSMTKNEYDPTEHLPYSSMTSSSMKSTV